jgi:hypothetical protein
MSATIRQTCARACQFDDDDNDERDQSFECAIVVNGSGRTAGL